MKKHHSYCAVIALLGVTPATGVSLFYEGFSADNYTAGSVLDQPQIGPGYVAGGAWNSTSEFVAGGLNHPTLVTTPGLSFSRTTGENSTLLDTSPTGPFGSNGLVGSNGQIGGTGITASVYFSVLAQKQGAAAGFAGFQVYDSTAGNAGEGLGVGEVSAGGFKWLQGGGNNFIGDPATPFSNDTLLFVFKIDFDETATTTGQVWINPDPTLTEGAQAAGISSLVAAAKPEDGFDSFRLRGNQPYSFDEIRMGTTWESVTPTVIPETSSTLLSLLALSGLSLKRSRRS